MSFDFALARAGRVLPHIRRAWSWGFVRRCRNVCLLFDCFGGLLQAQLDYALCISVRRLAFLYNVEKASAKGWAAAMPTLGRPQSPQETAEGGCPIWGSSAYASQLSFAAQNLHRSGASRTSILHYAFLIMHYSAFAKHCAICTKEVCASRWFFTFILAKSTKYVSPVHIRFTLGCYYMITARESVDKR